MTTSIIGFKEPSADLHRQSPKIFLGSMILSILVVAVGVNIPLIKKEKISKRITPPPVIIRLENIPETRQVAAVPAPKLAIPIEVEDDMMPEDVTIESTNLDLKEQPAPPPDVIVVKEEKKPELVEEEIFEFYAVEEQPERLVEVTPVYPESARKAGISGTVFVRALVDKTGNVEKAEVLKGNEALHEAAVKAALETKFKPAKQNDMPVKCWVQMSFRFVLE